MNKRFYFIKKDFGEEYMEWVNGTILIILNGHIAKMSSTSQIDIWKEWNQVMKPGP